MDLLERLESMLASGTDTALLRFSLGNEYLRAQQASKACAHLAAAVQQDPHYSAAWKLLGRAYSEHGDLPAAIDAYRKGIEVATGNGDIQAAKEMRVFARRLEKSLNAESKGAQDVS